ncbi:MAG: SOS response-associated peptidase [Phycisphaerales bacterium]|nr:SOS response-associated peptidase [Phycisphaerales bacterium]
MCGRFTRRYSWAQLHKLMSLCFPDAEVKATAAAPELRHSYNAAPTQAAHAVRAVCAEGDAMAAEVFCPVWGFAPAWMREKKGPKPINARAETVATNGLFRSAFAKGRCVVPLSSFYEWSGRAEGGKKQPWHIRRADEEIILAAGVWTQGDEPSFAIITTPANAFMAELHDRMPAILEPESVRAWCDPETQTEEAKTLLRPAPDGVLTAHKVSPRVNSVHNNDPSLIEPLQELF